MAMYDKLPFPARMFRVLYALLKHVEWPLPDDDIAYLLNMRCIDPVVGGGWLVNSRGRHYWRRHHRKPLIYDAIIAGMPMNTILLLKACEAKTEPKMEAFVIDSLIYSGYLIRPQIRGIMLTTKGHELLRSYNRILVDLGLNTR